MMPYENRSDSGWSEFLAGALIGAGVALLLAPQTGTELRGMLRDYATRVKEDLMEEGEDALNTAVERGQEFYDRGKEVAEDAGRSAKEFVKQGARQGRETVRDAGRAAQEFAKQAKEGAQEAAG